MVISSLKLKLLNLLPCTGITQHANYPLSDYLYHLLNLVYQILLLPWTDITQHAYYPLTGYLYHLLNLVHQNACHVVTVACILSGMCVLWTTWNDEFVQSNTKQTQIHKLNYTIQDKRIKWKNEMISRILMLWTKAPFGSIWFIPISKVNHKPNQRNSLVVIK